MPIPEDFDARMEAPKMYIEMPSGKPFRLDEPVFDFRDIAHTLSRKDRFNSNSHKFMSVAEHSVRVSYVTHGDPLEGLLHDITETYLPDVPAPWKALLPDFVALEHHIWTKFVKWLEAEHGLFLPINHTAELKEADWRALFIEAREVMPTQGRNWVSYDKYGPMLSDMPCWFWTPEEAEERFQLRLQELTWEPDE